MPDYADHMRTAIEAAARTNPHPNPRVGAVVLDAAGTVVGRGIHRRAGDPHAEVEALEQAGEAARGGTLIVTLEPCGHHGRTPPCVDAVKEAGISRVAIGAEDPDAHVAGAGTNRLLAAGIEVTTGVLAGEVESMDPAYFHHRRTGRPRVTLKVAMTLDGQVAAHDGSSQWITSEEARRDGHALRAESDAIMVGAGTARADDPELTVRLPGYEGRQPIPVLIAGRRRIPDGLRLLERHALVFAPITHDMNTEVVVMESGHGVDLEKALVHLGERGVVELLVEGGPTLAGALLRARLLDRCVFYLGAKLGGGTGAAPFGGLFQTIADAIDVEMIEVRPVGPDLRVEFTLTERKAP